MDRQRVISRLLYLRNWEFINIFFLPLCLYISLNALDVQDWQPYVHGMLAICLVLAQGVFYWHLKLRIITKSALALPGYFYRSFLFFKWLDVLFLSLYPLLAVAGGSIMGVPFHVSVWSNLLFAFAIIEYINYYHYQLSHDNLEDLRYLFRHRKIRRSPLSVDLRQTRPG